MAANRSRRRFTAEYKHRILQLAERCKKTRGLSKLLREEGLHASHIANWRAKAALGLLVSLAPKKRGPPKDLIASHNRAIKGKDREIADWKRRALRAEALVELQKASLAAAKGCPETAAKHELRTIARAGAIELGVSSTCDALGVSRSTYYRELAPAQESKQRRTPGRRLSDAERQRILELITDARFTGLSTAVVHAKLLKEGRDVCSVRTMHRLLAERREGATR